MTDGLREQIAEIIYDRDSFAGDLHWSRTHPTEQERCRRSADTVLALPAVRDLLAAAEAVQRVKALADHYRDLCMWDEDGRRRTLHRSVSDRIRRALAGDDQ